MLCRGQLRGRFCTDRYNNFTPAVPASAERGTSRLSSCSVVLRPPVSELLVPAFHVSGAAGADMGSPYGGMLLRVHCDLLLPCSYHRCCTVRSTNRLVYNIVPCHAKIKQVIIIIIINN